MLTPALGLFVDVEKEPYGRGDLTLFLYDRQADHTGNILRPDARHEDPAFTTAEAFAAAEVFDVQRVYIGARRTSMRPEWVSLWSERAPNLAITFETENLVDADLAEKLGQEHRVTVVARVCSEEEFHWVVQHTSFVAKIEEGRYLRFGQRHKLWDHDSEIAPDIVLATLENSA